MIKVGPQPFDPGGEINAFCARNNNAGAIATFVGQVRDYASTEDGDRAVAELILEHYPGMTEKELSRIVAEAESRWAVAESLVIHRYGPMKPGEAIVLVCTASEHRGDAFAACEFIMDWLKTSAPFWKKESSADGGNWVEARRSDDARAQRWNSD